MRILHPSITGKNLPSFTLYLFWHFIAVLVSFYLEISIIIFFFAIASNIKNSSTSTFFPQYLLAISELNTDTNRFYLILLTKSRFSYSNTCCRIHNTMWIFSMTSKKMDLQKFRSRYQITVTYLLLPFHDVTYKVKYSISSSMCPKGKVSS